MPDDKVLDFQQAQPLPAQTAKSDSERSPSLLFVTGASRSGTTMLARMMGAHSEILTFQELHYFGSMWDPNDPGDRFSAPELSELAAVLKARQNRGLWGGKPSEVERSWGRRLVREMPSEDCTAANLYRQVASRLATDAGKQFACEQTPRNIFYARKLLEVYPDARFIHIVRDPRAVLASQKNRWRMRKMGAHHLPLGEMLRNRVNYHPITMGKLWRKANEEASLLSDHPRFMVVRFEDLAAAPAIGAQRLCNFLGVKFEPDMLDIPRWGSSNVSHTQENTGVSADVLDQWQESLTKSEILLCEKITAPVMEKFGYTPKMADQYNTLKVLPSLLTYPLHVAGVVSLNPGRALTQMKAMARINR